MKASELRIGNWFLDDDNIPRKLRLFEFQDEDDIEDVCLVWGKSSTTGEYSFLEHSKPIPLTEEWLLRFGINTWFLDGRFSIVLNEDGSFSVYAHANGRSVFIKHISYVHTLQNFYHVLKGQELTINEGK